MHIILNILSEKVNFVDEILQKIRSNDRKENNKCRILTCFFFRHFRYLIKQNVILCFIINKKSTHFILPFTSFYFFLLDELSLNKKKEEH